MKIPNQINEKLERYKTLVLMILCLAIILYVYQSTANQLLAFWLTFDESMSHGLLVALTCIFLIYKSNAWRENEVIRPDFFAAIPLMITSMLWGIAHIVGINIIEQLLLPILFLSAVLLVLGRDITRLILIPVMFIYFAIPVWDYLNYSLLQITVIVVQKLIRWSDITAYIEGNSIFLPSGEILIASGCSGLRYFIVGCFLSVLSAYLYYSSLVARILIVFMCMGLALLANWIRVYGITMIAHISEMQSPIIGDHETLGWILFMIFMAPLFYMNYSYSDQEDKQGDDTKKKSAVTGKRRRLFAVVLLVLFVCVGPIIVNQTDYNANFRFDENVMSAKAAGQWEPGRKEETDFLWSPHFQIPDNYVFQSFSSDDADVGLFIFPYYQQEKYGDIFPYISSIYDPAMWSLIKSSNYNTHNKDIQFTKFYLVNKYNQEKLILVYQYNVGGHTTTKFNLAKLYQVPAILSRNAYAILTVVSMKCDLECNEADKKVNSFLEEVLVNMVHVK